MSRMLRAILFVSALAVVALVAQHPRAETVRAAFPGGNGKIAFITHTPTQQDVDIFVINADGSGEQPLIASAENERDPAWSADGQKIAFTRHPVNSSAFAIWTANANGSGQAKLIEGASIGTPSWSPDGKEIAITRDGGIAVINLATLQVRQITTKPPDFADGAPKWSPNGDLIVFSGGRGSTPEDTRVSIWLVKPDGTGLRRLTTGNHVDTGPTWSPDGSEIAFIRGSASGAAIVAMSPNGGAARQIVDTDTIGYALAWSPSGEDIAFIKGEVVNSQPVHHIYLADANGSSGSKITSANITRVQPDWQPLPTLIDEVEFTQAAQVVQSIPALKADLETDGKPPVPIVAGKPAAMRVYFKEVEDPVTYVIDSNLTAEDITVTLLPGCDEIERRAQKDNCESVDFYFLPPVGDYEADVIVRTPGGEVVEEHTFALTSERSPQLVLVAVSVCDNQIAPYVWDCGDQTKVDRLASFLRAVAPTDKVEVHRHNAVVMRVLPEHPTVLVGSEWYWGVRDQVEALYVADQAAGLLPTGKVIYVGVTREGLPVPYYGLSGPHSLVFGTTASPQGVEVAPEILAHEAGHVLGANHTNSDQPRSDTRPGCYAMAVEPTPDWPELDNFLYTVGFDTITGEAKPGTEWFELMGYCGPQWISTHTTLKILAGLNAPATASVSSASAPGDGWLISGTISEGAVTFAPLLERDDLTPSASSGGQYTLEVRGAGDAVLSSHAFDATAGEPVIKEGVTPPEATPFFSIVVPTQAGAESIVVLEGSDELGGLQLTGAAPTVVFDTLPGSPISGEQQVSWTITDADSSLHTSWLEYSRDGGTEWETIAAALADNGLTVDFGVLGGSDTAMLRVLVSDGSLTGAATSEPFTVEEKGPEASIVAPENGSAYRVTEIVGLQAAAFDPEGDVTVTWSSNKDGNLGAGATLPVEGLSAGTHTITMTARDSDNNSLSDTITVTVSDLPLVEGEEPGVNHIWGDNDCNGAITTRDNQALLRNILQQQPLSQTQPCPALGDVVSVGGASVLWGDLDCNGAIGARDGQALLRNVLGQPPLSQTQPCPAIGDTVAVGALSFSRLLFGKVAHQPPGLRAFGDPFVPG